jgi:hypothetical protein
MVTMEPNLSESDDRPRPRVEIVIEGRAQAYKRFVQRLGSRNIGFCATDRPDIAARALGNLARQVGDAVLGDWVQIVAVGDVIGLEDTSGMLDESRASVIAHRATRFLKMHRGTGVVLVDAGSAIQDAAGPEEFNKLVERLTEAGDEYEGQVVIRLEPEGGRTSADIIAEARKTEEEMRRASGGTG